MYKVFIKYCVFSKNFQNFAAFPSPVLDHYWSFRKWPANKRDRTLILRVGLLHAGDGLQGEITQFLMNTLYLDITVLVSCYNFYTQMCCSGKNAWYTDKTLSWYSLKNILQTPLSISTNNSYFVIDVIFHISFLCGGKHEWRYSWVRISTVSTLII